MDRTPSQSSASQPADTTIGGRSFAEHNASDSNFVGTPRKPASDSQAALHAQRDRLIADIANRFTYHAPRGDQLPRYAALRDRARELALMIVDLTPTSREQALALTHLEESIFFANAAIARNE